MPLGFEFSLYLTYVSGTCAAMRQCGGLFSMVISMVFDNNTITYYTEKTNDTLSYYYEDEVHNL